MNRKALKPIITVAAVDVQCPNCQEFISEPYSGSKFFDINEYHAGSVLECDFCHASVKLPALKSVKVR
jgi:hypothetical protein